MDLSILIISWNTLEMTRDCLRSVFAGLNDLEAEVVVVDNASEDGTVGMIEAEFPQVHLIRNTDNRGFAAANNQAIAVARGRHMLLLNSDTLVRGDVLPASVAWMDAHADVGAMSCRVLNTDGSPQRNNIHFPTLGRLTGALLGLRAPAADRIDGDDVVDVDVVAGCYMAVRAAAIEQVGPLDDGFFFFGEETDWCRRLRDGGWRVVHAPVGEITHHGGGSVRRLNHRRDVMLSGATVRLQRKHGGALAGAAAFGLVLTFNASRAVLWTILSPVLGERARTRAIHFRRVTAASGETWSGGARP